MEDSGNLNPLNSKPQGRCLTFFTPKKWIRTSSKSLFILKFKSTVLLSQNSYKIPKSPRSYVGEHASVRGSPWGGKHWRQRSSMEATCCHVRARASTKTRSSHVVSVKKRISMEYVGTFGQPIFTEYSVKCTCRICIYVGTSGQPTFYWVLGKNGISWQPTLPIQYRNSREFVGTYGKPTFYRVVGKI